MRASLIFTLLFSIGSLGASIPKAEKRTFSDQQTLQYLLTVKNLENAFYHGGLAIFEDSDFTAVGAPAGTRSRFLEISAQEQAHVNVLAELLGGAAPQPCTYNFFFSGASAFIALAKVIENVSVSSLLGVTSTISNKAYLTDVAAILASDARHATYIASTVQGGDPWSGAFDTPLDAAQVYSLLVSPITFSCPSTNPVLPIPVLASLGIDNNPSVGGLVQLDYTSTGNTEYLAILHGLSTTYSKITNKTATLPAGLKGIFYGVVTTSTGTSVTDASTVAGTVIFAYPETS